MSGDNPSQTLTKRFKYHADKDPNKDGFIFVGQSMDRLVLTRFQLWNLIGRYASRIRRHGIQTGDVVCSMIKTSRTKLITTFGVIAAGGVVVNGLTILADGQDIFTVLNTSKCETILTSWNRPEFIFLQKFLKMGKGIPSADFETVVPVECEQAPCVKQLIVYELNSHEDHTAFLSSLEGEDFYEAPVTADDEAHIFLTSGSTSYSKMVPRTHRECLAYVDSLDFGSDVVLNNREIEWMAAFPCAYLCGGATTIVQEYTDRSVKLSLPEIWNFACDMGATVAMMVPEEMMIVKQAYEDGIITRPIKRYFCSGQPIKKCLFGLVGVTCQEMVTIYASTEAGSVVSGLVTRENKDTVKDCYAGDRLLGNVQMKIVDEKTNRKVTGPNQVGKLLLKGGTVLRHYMNVETSTSGVFTADGWFDTSDVGYIDDVGGIHVIGRTSDIILNGTRVVYPQWLEERIQKCPGVASVVVVGIPHPVKFQEICVCVVKEKNSTLTEQELEKFCATIFTDVAGIRDGYPKKFYFMEKFPQNSTGKISRKAILSLATEHFQGFNN